MLHQIYSDSDTGFWRFFCETRILACESAQDARIRLAWLIEAHKVQSPLILTDFGVRKTRFFSSLAGNQSWPVFAAGSEGESAPLEQILRSEQALACDMVVAIGGGSVLDAAKILAACLPNNLDPNLLPEKAELSRQPLPLLCVPTTFGTGSEVNMYTHLTGKAGKLSFRRSWLTPTAALICGEAGLEMPQDVRYLTAVDAWVHAFEALTLKRERSPIGDALLTQALALHDQHFSQWLSQPNAKTGLAMATAACLGGLGIHNGRTGLIHALASPYAARFNLPHQHSLLPFILPAIEFNWPAIKGRFSKSLQQFSEGLRASILSRAESIVQNGAIHPDNEDLEALTHECCRDRVLFKENPQPLDQAAVLKLYRQALG